MIVFYTYIYKNKKYTLYINNISEFYKLRKISILFSKKIMYIEKNEIKKMKFRVFW